jgi:hypothetical protein
VCHSVIVFSSLKRAKKRLYAPFVAGRREDTLFSKKYPRKKTEARSHCGASPFQDAHPLLLRLAVLGGLVGFLAALTTTLGVASS